MRRIFLEKKNPIINEAFDPRARDGSRYILSSVDYTARNPKAMALANIDAVSVAEALMSAYSRVGIPKQILSDRGTQFA